MTGASSSHSEGRSRRTSEGETETLIEFRPGDRCPTCLHWFWPEDGAWHSLVPRQMADYEFGPPAEEIRYVGCQHCA